MLRRKRKFLLSKRWIMALLGFFGFINIYAMRVDLSVAVVAMVDYSADTSPKKNGTEVCESLIPKTNRTGKGYKGERYNWRPTDQGKILGSFFYGYVLTQLLGGTCAEKFGAKWLFGGGILLTAILSVLTPLAANAGIYYLMALRVAEGLSEGVTFPSMNCAISRWAPKLERSRMSTIIFTGALVGNVIAMPVSGWLCSTEYGWPSVFHAFGTMGCVWFVFWAYLVYENPSDHPTITEEEKSYIDDTNQRGVDYHNLAVPWKEIATSLPFWAVLVAHFGNQVGFLMLLTELPSYMDAILHFDIKENGLLSAVPYIVQTLCAWVIALVADRMRKNKILKTTTIRKLFTAIGMLGPAVCMLVITVSGCRPRLIVTLLTLAMGINGCIYSGYNVTHVDMSPDFAGTLYGITNTVCNFGGIIGPEMVGYFTRNGATIPGWNAVFYITAAIYVFAAAFFVLFASAENQPWGVVTLEDIEDAAATGSDSRRPLEDQLEEEGAASASGSADRRPE